MRNATSTLSATEQGRQTETERYVCRWMQHLSDDVRLLAQLSMFHLPDEREREKQIRNLCSYNQTMKMIKYILEIDAKLNRHNKYPVNIQTQQLTLELFPHVDKHFSLFLATNKHTLFYYYTTRSIAKQNIQTCCFN